jgi:hypothetical protein
MWGANWGAFVWGGRAVPALSCLSEVLFVLFVLGVGYQLGRRAKESRWLQWVPALLVGVVPIVARAAAFTLPFNFVNGTVADATQVNANFSTLGQKLTVLTNVQSIVDSCDFQEQSDAPRYCGDIASPGGGASHQQPNHSRLVAPLRVPVGAKINQVAIYVRDVSPSTNLSLCVLSGNIASSSNFPASACGTTSAISGFGEVLLNLNPPIVQEDSGLVNYWIEADSIDTSGNSNGWPTDKSLTIRIAHVTYSL